MILTLFLYTIPLFSRVDTLINQLKELENTITTNRLESHHTCNGRLTLEAGVPISITDQTGISTLYFTPYLGNKISLYDGSKWNLKAFTEKNLSLSSLTANKNYDVFLYDNSGTLTLELSAAWTNDTTRTDLISLQDGIYVKDATKTRRYLGTIRTTGTTTTEDSETKRFVWNYYHRTSRRLYKLENTDSWSGTGNGVWEELNSSTSNRVEFTLGVADTYLNAKVYSYCSDPPWTICSIGVGLDSTSSNSAVVGVGAGTNTIRAAISAEYSGYPGIGYHYLQVLQHSPSNMQTFYGDDGAPDYLATGILGGIEG